MPKPLPTPPPAPVAPEPVEDTAEDTQSSTCPFPELDEESDEARAIRTESVADEEPLPGYVQMPDDPAPEPEPPAPPSGGMPTFMPGAIRQKPPAMPWDIKKKKP